MEWRRSYQFATDAELEDWGDVAWWAGPDGDGHLWLSLHLGRAVARCGNSGELKQACARVVITQVGGTG